MSTKPAGMITGRFINVGMPILMHSGCRSIDVDVDVKLYEQANQCHCLTEIFVRYRRLFVKKKIGIYFVYFVLFTLVFIKFG